MDSSNEPAKVLIANRGEIACRIIRACRSLGLSPVAVYSEADATSQHVALADAAYPIGPPRVNESYLNVDAILSAAKTAGVEAIHPGYGLLSENPGFAQAVTDAGITWVGPAPETMRLLADKHVARDIASAADVPVLPGSAKFDGRDVVDPAGHDLGAAAAAVGFPLLVKATGGGGGIGMQVCTEPGKLAKLVESVSGLAERAFGDPGLFLERYVERAHHVEVQVFGFGNGEVVHLFDRECSVQRRFQKVIEEAPAPCLSPSLRERLTQAACRLASAQNYVSAGTVEFVYDEGREEFYFLEMNTRIQVEHPVTECITGEDLVARQLKFALGLDDAGRAPVAQTYSGHAIECRIYAENPAKKFFPSPGPLEVYELPEADERIRVDTGFAAGDTITPFYDPLIAKLITRGEDRAEAIDVMRQALDATRIEGVRNNAAYLRRIMDHPAFVAGNTDTRFIERHHNQLQD
ncbi:MAG: acetyl-CoA carboxylase biotin carboxylase subunit [Chromatiales bacterium]|jgi:3-methylcrotonyl-CoA carboxylase alpha subunit|nr:acetyl-CoA carboxylase biotin carboxylase subunit [Chromatiales bacterium]